MSLGVANNKAASAEALDLQHLHIIGVVSGFLLTRPSRFPTSGLLNACVHQAMHMYTKRRAYRLIGLSTQMPLILGYIIESSPMFQLKRRLLGARNPLYTRAGVGVHECSPDGLTSTPLRPTDRVFLVVVRHSEGTALHRGDVEDRFPYVASRDTRPNMGFDGSHWNVKSRVGGEGHAMLLLVVLF